MPDVKVCFHFSKPKGCSYGDSCRFQHIPSTSAVPSTVETNPKDPAKAESTDADAKAGLGESTNNQNAPPDNTGAGAYPKDTKYFQQDGSGVFLVDGVLFKVQATAIYGPRPGAIPQPNKAYFPVYLEDILPKLSSSSHISPIEIPSITKKQFQTYLLSITGLPYDKEYLSLLVDYSSSEKHSPDLFLQYLDIATIAPRFGMTKLAEWAVNAFQVVFTESANSFRHIPYDWKYSTLLQLRELTRETALESPVRAFIQYLIHKITQDIRHNQGAAESWSKITDLVEIYRGFKDTGDDGALLGCVFLNILSLGHRSQVWSSLTRDDKAILYAAQAQLTNLPEELAPGSLAWVAKPDPELARDLCTDCQISLSSLWDKLFRECNQELGSSIPLKDVLLLAEMPEYRWALWSEMNEVIPDACTAVTAPSSPSTSDTHLSRPKTCSISPLVSSIDQHIQGVHEQVASRYRSIAK